MKQFKIFLFILSIIPFQAKADTAKDGLFYLYANSNTTASVFFTDLPLITSAAKSGKTGFVCELTGEAFEAVNSLLNLALVQDTTKIVIHSNFENTNRRRALIVSRNYLNFARSFCLSESKFNTEEFIKNVETAAEKFEEFAK